jgi:acetyl coenzyme A synthetase (ADP forming)-like protein
MPRTLLSEADGYELLKSAGIPVPKFAVALSAEEAVATAGEIGFPLVMKVISPQVVHKSDAGGVVTGIKSPAEAGSAYASIVQNVKAFNPAATITGIIVEQQLAPGLELIVGGRTDPTFGKVITVGFGGTLVELLKDVSVRVLPVDENEIRRMVRELRGYRLVQGFRGEAARDEEAFVGIVAAAARMFEGNAAVEEFDINPVLLYEKGGCAVDARVYVSDATGRPAAMVPEAPLNENILDIHSIAVVGASQDPNKVGYAICRNLLSFPGKLYPVNPKSAEILGRKTYPTLTSIPDKVDASVISIPAYAVPQIVEEAGEKGIPLLIIISSGFRETGEAGRQLEDHIVAIAKRYGTRIMGPNCLGLMLPVQGINTTFDPVSPKPGKIAFISQSGALITTIVDWSLPEEIGFSGVFSMGNQADLTFEDFIVFAGHDPATKAIILYIEQIRDGKRFMEVMGQVTLNKPVVAIKSGTSKIGQKAASSHTGSLAGSSEVYSAAFRQAGVIGVQSIREAFQAAELLASEGYPKGIRAVVISNAGGFAVLSSDYAERFGIDLIEFSPELVGELDAILPKDWSRENPIDMVGDASADRFAKTFDVMIRSQDLWDIAFVIAVPSAISDPIRVANELVRFSKHTHKMTVGCMIGGDSMKTPLRILRDAGIPNFPDLEDAFRTVGNICRHKCGEHEPGKECR